MFSARNVFETGSDEMMARHLAYPLVDGTIITEEEIVREKGVEETSEGTAASVALRYGDII